MSMGTYIRVDTESYVRHLSFFFCEFVDYFKFLGTFYVETEYTEFNSDSYFLITLSHTCKDNLFDREACFACHFYFFAAHAVGTESGTAYDIQQCQIGVGFQCIVHDESFVPACFFAYCLQRLAEQVSVVIVERCLFIFKLVCWKCPSHRN